MPGRLKNPPPAAAGAPRPGLPGWVMVRLKGCAVPGDVEVLGGDGPPQVRLHGAVADRAAELGVEIGVSLTHTRRDAAAVAILR